MIWSNMQQEINIYNFEDHFIYSVVKKQNDGELLQKIHKENKQFSIERIKEKIKDDFFGELIKDIFQYRKYKRYEKYSEDFTKKQYEYHLKYNKCIDYMYDEKLNTFIINILSTYPIFFAGVPQTKDKPNPVTIDKSLKYLFLNNITVKNYKTAVEMLLEKQKYNDDNDELMKTLNSLHNESSLSDLDSMLLDDIKLNVNKDKVDIMKLKTYLKKEILLRIKNNLNENVDVNSKIIEEEKKLALSELEQALQDGKSMEDFWDSF